MFNPSRTLTLLAASSFFALAACGGGGGDRPDTQLRRGIGSNPDSVDPHQAEGTWANDVIGDMFVGLTTENPASEPVPGVATSWETSEDGLTWTFHLRESNWSDGTPLTAHDFVFGFRRLLDPNTIGAVYASLQYPIKNAQAINGGAMPVDQLGVTAIDDYTLQVELEYPAPYLPGLFKHYTAYPIPQHVVEQYGDDWTRPENIVVNGPYKLVEWRSGDFLRSVKNPEFYDADSLCFDEIVYYTASDHDAMVRLAQAGQIDMNQSFPTGRLQDTEDKLPGWPRTEPTLSTTYVVANQTEPPFDDIRVRKALAMAMDREYITSSILQGGENPTYSFVPPGIANYPDHAEFEWKDMPRDQRLAEAKSLLEAAGFGPNNPFEFEYQYRATSNNPRIAPVLQANWSDIADWVRPSIRQVETQALYNSLQNADYALSDSAWIADYNDAYNFLYLMDSGTGPMNYGRYNNPEYDRVLRASNMELDPAKRAQLLKQAEQILLNDVAAMPLLNTVSQELIDPDLTGILDNPERIHRSRYMCRATMSNE